MKSIIIIFILLCGYTIFKNRGQKRLDWFICSILIFSSAIIIIDKPQLPCHRFFILCYWGSVLRNHELQCKRFPLIIPLVIYTIGIVIVGFNSTHLTFFYKIYKPLMLVIDTYLVILLGFMGTNKETFYSKRIINVLFFVTLYGMLTLAISNNPIHDIVTSAFDIQWREGYFFGERTRICSTWNHPIAYGLICSILFFEYLQYVVKSNKIKLLLVLLAFNVFTCGSRTALAAFLMMGVVIIIMRYNIAKSIKLGVIVIAASIPVYFLVPMVQEKVDSVILTAMGDTSVSGSSLEMRNTQTEAAMIIVAEAPLLGHGIDYIGEVMGYGTDNFTGDWHLLGFESYSYIILIERGFFGLFIEFFILCSILFYAIKHRKRDMLDTSFIISIIIGFIFFSVSTGTLDTFMPVMFMIGMAMSKVHNKIYLSHETKKLGHRNTCL